MQVGSDPPDGRFFTMQSINPTTVRIHSLNDSFPDTTATLFDGDGKIAFRAKLFDGKSYRGIMRSNGHGTPGCCEVKEPSKKHPGPGPSLSRCPVVSWWSDEGNRSCWETVTHPSEPEGACDE